MSKAERSSIGNGIWMCFTHGKIIDTDERRFSIGMLQQWRAFAELRARMHADFGNRVEPNYSQLANLGFAEERLLFQELGAENKMIGDALFLSCVPMVWGKELCDALRDLLIELVRNAFIHGQATSCNIHIKQRSIHLDDNGLDFDWIALKSSQKGRGGQIAVKHLLNSFKQGLVICSERIAQKNQTVFAFAQSLEDVEIAEPCYVSVQRAKDIKSIKSGTLPKHLFPDAIRPCRVLYIVLPRYMPPSDAVLLEELDRMVSAEIVVGKQLVFVFSDISWYIEAELGRLFPGCILLHLNYYD